MSTPKESNKVECLICKGDNNTTQYPIIMVDCCPNAVYHQSCVTEYLKTKKNCPACTKEWEVDKENVVISNCNNCNNFNIKNGCQKFIQNIWNLMCYIGNNKYIQIYSIFISQVIIQSIWLSKINKDKYQDDILIFETGVGYLILCQINLVLKILYTILAFDITIEEYYGKEINSWLDNQLYYPKLFLPLTYNLFLGSILSILNCKKIEYYTYAQAGYWILDDLCKFYKFHHYIQKHHEYPYNFVYIYDILQYLISIGGTILMFLSIHQLTMQTENSTFWKCLIFPILGINTLYWTLQLLIGSCFCTVSSINRNQEEKDLSLTNCMNRICECIINYPFSHTTNTCWAKFKWVYYYYLDDKFNSRIQIWGWWIKYDPDCQYKENLIFTWLFKLYWTYNFTFIFIPVTAFGNLIDTSYLLTYLVSAIIFQYIIIIITCFVNYCRVNQVVTRVVIKGAKSINIAQPKDILPVPV